LNCETGILACLAVNESQSPNVKYSGKMKLMIRAVLCAILAMTASFAASGQSVTNSPAFEVASVKPNRTGVTGSALKRSGSRIAFDNVSLRECIAFAYGIADGRDYELSSPAWLDSEKFDIAATFPPETSRDRVREMLQTLLAERFHLKAHRENRTLKAYALVVAKRGSKLTQASDGEDAFIFGEGHVTARALSMSSFADRLSGPVFKLEQPVVDMTSIKGVYDFTLEWAPDGVSVDGHAGASIFTALQEQLGLKLEVREIAAGILVVDHADRVPTGN
jgi:uncharacterized protein (TIGR03435 family)